MTTLSNVPPTKYVPSAMHSTFAEHEKLRVEESAARTAAHQLTDDQLDHRAKRDDDIALGEAVRAGSVPKITDPNRAKLAADRTAADIKAMQLRVALESVARDVNTWVANNTDALVSHESAILHTAANDYAAAIEAALTARRNYYEARAAKDWAELLASGRKSQLSWIGARYDSTLDTELRKDAHTHEARSNRSVTGIGF